MVCKGVFPSPSTYKRRRSLLSFGQILLRKNFSKRVYASDLHSPLDNTFLKLFMAGGVCVGSNNIRLNRIRQQISRLDPLNTEVTRNLLLSFGKSYFISLIYHVYLQQEVFIPLFLCFSWVYYLRWQCPCRILVFLSKSNSKKLPIVHTLDKQNFSRAKILNYSTILRPLPQLFATQSRGLKGQ